MRLLTIYIYTIQRSILYKNRKYWKKRFYESEYNKTMLSVPFLPPLQGRNKAAGVAAIRSTQAKLHTRRRRNQTRVDSVSVPEDVAKVREKFLLTSTFLSFVPPVSLCCLER